MRSHVSICLLALAVCLGGLNIFPQTPVEGIVWHGLRSDTGEFSVAVPAGYVVNQQLRWSQTTLAGGAGQMSFTATFTSTGKGGSMMKELHEDDLLRGWTDSDYEVGKAKIHVASRPGKTIYKVYVSIATRKGFYVLSAAAPSADNRALVGLLASLRVDGLPVMKLTNGVAPPAVATTADVRSIESSEIVKRALARIQTSPVEVDLKSREYEDDDEEEILYSRPLIAVYKPAARYTDEARGRNVEGSVVLRVLFRANGDVGRIRVVKGLPSGLTAQAIEAAKRLKFVPAEKDGKPADSERNLVYTFTIY